LITALTTVDFWAVALAKPHLAYLPFGKIPFRSISANLALAKSLINNF